MAEDQHTIDQDISNDPTVDTTEDVINPPPQEDSSINPDADTAPLTQEHAAVDKTKPLDQSRVAVGDAAGDETQPLDQSRVAVGDAAGDETQPLDQSRVGGDDDNTAPPPQAQHDDSDGPDEPEYPDIHDTPGDSAVFGETTGQLHDDDTLPTISPSLSVQGLAAAALRDVGRVREVNQDSVFALLTTLPYGTSDMSVGLFIVADGMGGHQSGEIASNLAIRAVFRHIMSYFIFPTIEEEMADTMQSLMISAVEHANMDIWQHAQRYSADLGTTCTAALMVGETIYIAHVGDSRAYVLEGDTLRPITTDHSAVGRLIELGQLEPSAAREHPLRNQLYRAIGQGAEVEVDFLYQPLEGVTHLLLCSDGLWDLVEEEQMVEAMTRSHWPQDACHELVALANLNGGDDNISAVVVTFPVEDRLF